MPTSNQTEEELHTVLERARTAGFLGPGPLRSHTDHARAFEHQLPSGGTNLLDLGSGGGVPGIPIFVRNPELSGVLLDASEKRCAFLQWAVAELGLADRVAVERGRAEDLGHHADLRHRFDVVTCRGFGPPAATVEGAVGFLAPGGLLVISEPPGGRSWSSEGLKAVGLELAAGVSVQGDEGGTQGQDTEALSPVVSFRMTGEVPSGYPRPLRQQRSRPLPVLL